MILKLDHLGVGYGAASRVAAGLSFGAAAGEFVCVLGRNGVGKSTLLRTVSGLQAPVGGSVVFEGGIEVASMQPVVRAQKIAVVLTERVSSPGLRVDDVMALARQPFTRWPGRLGSRDVDIVGEALDVTGAGHLCGRFVDALSDGERQRVMIARAIAQQPRLMVLDEVTAFLDLPARVEMMLLLKRLARERGMCVLLSSHDLDLSLELADCLWLFDGRGGVVTGGTHDLVQRGAVGAVFDTAEVRFSATLRRFELAPRPAVVPA